MKNKFKIWGIHTCYFGFFLGALFIPFPFRFIPFPVSLGQLFFGDLLVGILERSGRLAVAPEITSDSASLYLLILLLFVFAAGIGFLLLWSKKWLTYQPRVFNFIRLFLTYYLAMQLLKYGCDKIFKAQFYLPEPNILYTPFGAISKDLLFWSTMGTSRSYNIFMGALEVIPALLLLFARTRLVGLLFALPVLTNIVAINLGFDISVKAYSLFLWATTLFLLSPYLSRLYHFLVLQQASQLSPAKSISFQSPWLKNALKIFAISILLLEGFFPYLNTRQWNDDQSARPYLHGAYEVIDVSLEDQNYPLATLGIKKLFIHRKGYLIFQNQNDQLQDFKLDIDLLNQQFYLTDYQQKQSVLAYHYQAEEEILYVQYFYNDQAYWLKTRPLAWRSLPALQNDFHWMIEGVQ